MTTLISESIPRRRNAMFNRRRITIGGVLIAAAGAPLMLPCR